MRRFFFALAALSTLAACGGGGGGSSGGGAGIVPPAATPTPTQMVTSTPGVGTTVSGTPVPAPSDSSIPGLIAGGASAMPYIQSLAATIATPAPPSGNIAIAGIVQAVSSNSVTISTSQPSSASSAVFLGTNLALPASITVTYSSSTLIDGPNGIFGLANGTLILAAGQLSGATLQASSITPFTSATTTAGSRRMAPSLRIAGVQTTLLTPALVNRSIAVGKPVSRLSTTSSQNLTFTFVKGVPGVNTTFNWSVNLSNCTTLALATNLVAGLGVSYTWPMSIAASEASPITVGTAGTVSMIADPTTPSSPNFVISDGLVAEMSGTLTITCAPFNGQTFNLASGQVGLALAINDTVPAQFGNTATTIDSGTVFSPGSGANIVCLPLAPLPSWWSISTLADLASIQACPRMTLSGGALTFGSVNGTNANITTQLTELTPNGSVGIEPLGTLYSITGSAPSYQYTQQAGLDVQLSIHNQPYASITANIPPVTLQPQTNTSSLSWTLDAAPSPAPGQTLSPSPSPSASPTASPGAATPWLYVTSVIPSGAVTAYTEQGTEVFPTGAFPSLSYASSVAYDSHTGRLYVTNFDTCTMVEFDTVGNTLATTAPLTSCSTSPPQAGPESIVFDSHNNLIYADMGYFVDVVDELGNAQTEAGGFTWPSPRSSNQGSMGMAYDSHNNLIYLDHAPGSIDVYGGVTVYNEQGYVQSVSGTFPNLTAPQGMAFDPHNDHLYVVNGGSGPTPSVLVYDEFGNQQATTGSFSSSTNATAIAYDPNNNWIYVVSVTPGEITAYDEQGNVKLQVPYSLGAPQGATFAP